MSATSDINAITLQVYAEAQAATDVANGSYDANVASQPGYYAWQGSQQTIPMGMDGDPEGFAAALRSALPAVNTLRLPFNAWSFNADGSLDPQYERFLAAAAAQGFHLILTYADGALQQLGNGDGLSATEVYDQLSGAAGARMQATWTQMLDWTAAHADVAAAVYGYEAANEPAAYMNGAQLAGDAAGQVEFTALYAHQMADVAAQIEARSAAHVLIGGWAYSAQFDALATAEVDGQSAIDYLRQQVGDALVWSAHFYPGWHATGDLTDPTAIGAAYAEALAPLGSDNIIVTETSLRGDAADNWQSASQTVFAFARAQEWLGDHGIGIGWFVGAETGASNLVVVDPGGQLRFLHQASFALAMNGFTLDDHPAGHAGGEVLDADLIAGRLRNEMSDPDYNPDNPFDPVTHVGTAFGYDGNDTLQGSDFANNFLYGGAGDDRITGAAHEDFLFGQAGNDLITGGAGMDRLFGGAGDDTLVGGLGHDLFTGGGGADLFVADAGSDVIADFRPDQGDQVDFAGRYTTLDQITAHSQLVAMGGGAAEDLLIHHDDGSTTLILDLGRSLTAGEVAFDADPTPAAAGVSMLVAPVRIVQGGDGDDTLLGTSLDETLNGGGGNDRIIGTTGSTREFGGSGHDTLSSGTGASTLVGGAGNDRLEADVHAAGQHLIGGAGADTFVFTDHSGTQATHSEVADFTPGTDHLVIGGAEVDLAALSPEFTGETTAAGYLLHLDACHEVLFDGLFL